MKHIDGFSGRTRHATFFVNAAAILFGAAGAALAQEGNPSEKEGGSILDELGEDTGATNTGLPPRPSLGTGGSQTQPPSNPRPPGFHMYQELDSLSIELESAIRRCDRRAFEEAKADLLSAIDRDLTLEELTDQDKTSLRVRRQQADAMQFPEPCPPRESPPTHHRQPAPVVKSDPAAAAVKSAAPSTLLDKARSALIQHATAVGECDQAKMMAYLFLLDSLVQQALDEALEFTGSPFESEEERRKSVLAEIEGYRDAARKRMAECPKDLRIGLNGEQKTFLDTHNAERRLVGVPPLHWDPVLAASAKSYAVKLTDAGQLVHSSREGRRDVRENLLQSLPRSRTPAQMIGVWLAEKRNFTPGSFPDVSKTGNWYDIGHYSQMIWETTTHLGCATHGDARFEWLVCHYRPGGNKDGKPVGYPADAPGTNHGARAQTEPSSN